MHPTELFNPENRLNVMNLGLETTEVQPRFEFDPEKEISADDWKKIIRQFSNLKSVAQKSRRHDDDDWFTAYMIMAQIAELDPQQANDLLGRDDWNKMKSMFEQKRNAGHDLTTVSVVNIMFKINPDRAKEIFTSDDTDDMIDRYSAMIDRFTEMNEMEYLGGNMIEFAHNIITLDPKEKVNVLGQLDLQLIAQCNIVEELAGDVEDIAEFVAALAQLSPQTASRFINQDTWDRMVTDFRIRHETGDPLEYTKIAGSLSTISRALKGTHPASIEQAESSLPVTRNF